VQTPRDPGTDAAQAEAANRCRCATSKPSRSVSAGVLSQIERGVMIPPDRQISQLEAAYGAPIETWYDPRTLVVLQADGDDA
jgi:transcriptional regulator with XRE-family HTH domain